VLVGLFFVLARGFNGEGSGPPIGERGYLDSEGGEESTDGEADGTDETGENDRDGGSAGRPAADGGAR
jgi:multicomponent Na+:H+ antiporter subunit B